LKRRHRARVGADAEQVAHRLAVQRLTHAVRVVVRPALDQHEALRVRRRVVEPPAEFGPDQLVFAAVTTSSGEPMVATFACESKRCVISQPTGSQPQRIVATMSGSDVNVPSTIVPRSSSTRLASSIAIAPPSEWPKT
jgi:hypothetical protein